MLEEDIEVEQVEVDGDDADAGQVAADGIEIDAPNNDDAPTNAPEADEAEEGKVTRTWGDECCDEDEDDGLEISVPPAPKKPASLDDLEAFLYPNGEDSKPNDNEKPVHKGPGLTPEDTWDFSMKAYNENMKTKTIWLTPDKVASDRLSLFNAFGDCEHDVVKANCPCPSAFKFSVCLKCHTVFCSTACLKYSKDPTDKESNATSAAAKVNSNRALRDTSDGANNRAPKKIANHQQDANMGQNVNRTPNKPSFRHQNPNPPTPKPPLLPFPSQIPNQLIRGSLNYPNPFGNPSPTGNMMGNMVHGTGTIMGGPYGPLQYPAVFPNTLPFQPQFSPQGNAFPGMPRSGNMIPTQVFKHMVAASDAEITPNDVQMRTQTKGGNINMPGSARNSAGSDTNSVPPHAFPSVPKEETVRILRDPKPSGYLNNQMAPNNARIQTENSGMTSTPRFTPEARTPSKPNSFEGYREASGQKPNFVRSSPSIKNSTKVPGPAAERPHPNPKLGGLQEQESTSKIPGPLIFFGLPMTVTYLSGYSLFDLSVSTAFGKATNDRIKKEIDKIELFKPLKTLRKDSYGLGMYRYPEDENQFEWLRVRILDVKNDTDEVDVHFIDYGSVETLKRSLVMEMPPDLLNSRACSFRISIGDFVKNKETSEEVFELWLNKIYETPFRVTIFDQGQPDGFSRTPKHKAKIELYHQGDWLPLMDSLVKDGYGYEVPLFRGANIPICAADDLPEFATVNEQIQVIMGYVEDLSYFNVIPVTCLQQRDEMMSELNEGPVSSEFTISMWESMGFLGIAKRSDGLWSRCKIMAIPDDISAEVRFIDFGETTCVKLSNLKMLPSKFRKIPQLAYKCGLSIFPNSQKWDDTDIKWLRQLDVSTETFVVVYIRLTELKHHVVEVFLGKSSKGLTKTLSGLNKDNYQEVYKVNLDILKNRRRQEKENGNSSQSSLKCNAAERNRDQPSNGPQSPGQRSSTSASTERRPTIQSPEQRSSVTASTERRPTIQPGQRSFATASTERRPTIQYSGQRPSASSSTEKRPAIQSPEQRPSASASTERRPTIQSPEQRSSATASTERRPTIQSPEQRPSASASTERRPTIQSAERRPTIQSSERRPAFTSEERNSTMSASTAGRPTIENADTTYYTENTPTGASAERKPQAHSTSTLPETSSQSRVSKSGFESTDDRMSASPLSATERVNMTPKWPEGMNPFKVCMGELNKNKFETRGSDVLEITPIPSVESKILNVADIKVDTGLKPVKVAPIPIRGQARSSAESEYPFTVEKIQPGPPIPSLDKSAVFEIKYVVSFNRLYIVPSALTSKEYMQLQDEIMDCLSPTLRFDKLPPIGSVVITPHTDGNYYRAVIKKLIGADTAEVHLVDAGNVFEIGLDKIKPVNACVMRYPSRGYEVLLAGVDESPKLLLWQDFIEFMELSCKRRYLIQSCIVEGEQYTVSLMMANSLKQAVLSDLILKKEVWEWEKLYQKGLHNDTDLIAGGSWNKPAKVDDSKLLVLPIQVELEGEISRFSSEGDLWLVNVKVSSNRSPLQRDQEVLQNQIMRYADKVTATPFFPVINEAVLIFLNDVPDLRALNLRGIGRWNRCFREQNDGYYRNLDLDELYPMDSEFEIHFEVRKFCPDFFRVPLGIAECLIEGFRPSEVAANTVKTYFKPGKVIKFVVQSYDEETSVHSITCNELDDRIMLNGGCGRR